MTSLLLSVSTPVLAGLFDLFLHPADGGTWGWWLVGRVLVILAIIVVMLSSAAILSLAERRVSAWIQLRHGPNRVGPEGLFQPVADAGKFIFKEDIIPAHVNKVMYVLAPMVSLAPALVTFAVIPYTGMVTAEGSWLSFQAADLNIGVLFILAITSLGVYGLTLGGWASNSKYSLLGGVRSSAQMISYELSLGLAVVSIVLITSSLHLGNIVAWQGEHGWFVFHQPVAFFIFMIASYAETNRLPFDLPEAEQEIVAGYHTEYSSMKFASFFMAEYVNMTVSAALVVTLFCGGWTFFGLEKMGWLAGLLIFAAKVGFFLFLYIWVRWTLPRFRYDQLMRLGWSWFIPLALLNVVMTAGALALDQPWMVWLLPVLVIVMALLAAYFAPARESVPKLEEVRR